MIHGTKLETVEFCNPNGIESYSPGLSRKAGNYPGEVRYISTTPTGLRLDGYKCGTTPLGLDRSPTTTQGSSFLATLGYKPESHWDSSLNSNEHF